MCAFNPLEKLSALLLGTRGVALGGFLWLFAAGPAAGQEVGGQGPTEAHATTECTVEARSTLRPAARRGSIPKPVERSCEPSRAEATGEARAASQRHPRFLRPGPGARRARSEGRPPPNLPLNEAMQEEMDQK